jgi:KUP system potassium uptake protein
MLILASMATIIASQSVISGAFSIATQAVRLGYIPRLRVKHTSSEEMGQVYVSKINILLFVGVVALVLGFRSSEHLAAAYGVSVTGAMAIDTVLAGFLFVSMRGWNKWMFIPLFVGLFAIDMVFLGTNLFKFFDGGWLPVTVAAILTLVMVSWISGRERLLKARWDAATELKPFLDGLNGRLPQRVAGTAIFMVPNSNIVPMSLLHNMKHNKVIHERVILMHIQTVNEPYVGDRDRVTI